MADITQLPGTERLNPVGPARFGNSVIVDGRRIPHMAIVEKTDAYELFLDDRFCISVKPDFIHEVTWMVAQALAIGAGYKWIGGEKHGVPFAPQVAELKLK